MDSTLSSGLDLTPSGSGGLNQSGTTNVMKRKCNFITLEEKYKVSILH